MALWKPPVTSSTTPSTARAASWPLGLPAYLHIAESIAERIGNGEYRIGDQLPTEAELRQEFGVSPMTVRRAINILLDRQLVTTTQGKGTFVRSLELGEAAFRLEPITAVLDDESVEVSLLEARILPADTKVAGTLRLAEGARTICMRRLVTRHGVPLMYQVEQFIYDESRPVVEAQLEVTLLKDLLRSSPGDSMPSGELAIEAVSLDQEEAAILDAPEGSPAFCLDHTFCNFDGRPLSWGRLLCRADQFRLQTRIGVPPPPRRGKMSRLSGASS